MTPNEIKTWRPPTWSDFLGAANRPLIQRLQRAAIRREPPRPLLVVAPYGVGKTSLARHLMAAFCCEHPLASGDPCHECWECTHHGSEHNGEGYAFAHWELDCTRYTDVSGVRKVIQEIEAESKVAVFWDEFARLRVESAQALLLKPTEDVRGIWIVATTEDHYRRMDAQLFERFRKIWLTIPTVNELVDGFMLLLPTFGVLTSRDMIERMVRGTQRSFRSCLDILAAAAENENRTLDLATLEEFLSLDQRGADASPRLFSSMEE
jgi:replication-associated recombination protein RarA